MMICCRTMQREILAAMEQTGAAYPCIWLDSGLHNTPELLTDRLQKELDQLPAQTSRVLFGFGFCGNAVKGLKSHNRELIIPRADDCISLMLGSYSVRQSLMEEAGTYFLTEGWLEGERNIWAEYQHACKRYGQTRAKRIFDRMLTHYSRLAAIDTGTGNFESTRQVTEQIAETFGLQHQVINGTLSFLSQLLTGPWDKESFLVVPPGSTISLTDLSLNEIPTALNQKA